MELKEKLKQARSERKISQQALADAIFVSRSAVAKWESGLGVPCNESMEALEKTWRRFSIPFSLGVVWTTPDELFFGSG